MKTYKVEKLVKGKWEMHGTYPERFLPQMAQAIGNLYKEGYSIYDSLRIVEITRHGKSHIL